MYIYIYILFQFIPTNDIKISDPAPIQVETKNWNNYSIKKLENEEKI